MRWRRRLRTATMQRNDRLILSKYLYAALFGVMLLSVGVNAASDDLPTVEFVSADQIKISDAQVNSLWPVHWPRYADRYLKLDDDLVASAHYDTRYPSSSGVTMHEVLQGAMRKMRIQIFSNLVKDVRYTIPRAEAEAVAKVIPDLALGEYGYIHSAEVVQVLGPDEMVVKDVWLIDEQSLQKQMEQSRGQSRRATRTTRTAGNEFLRRRELVDRQDDSVYQQTHRIRKFPTRGLAVGERWYGTDRGQGIQVAVVAIDESLSKSSSRSSRFRRRSKSNHFIMIPAQLFSPQQVNEEQFLSVLTEADLGKQQFIATILEVQPSQRDKTVGLLIESVEAIRSEKRAEAAKAAADEARKKEREERRKKRRSRRDRNNDDG